LIFRIDAGEMVAVMGPSGSGKSTLLHILGCVDKPSKGKYTLDGADIQWSSQARLAWVRGSKVGLVFQHFALISQLQAVENVELPLEYLRERPREARRRATDALHRVGLTEKQIKRLPGKLSGGQQQRVAIARALVTNPKVILADEPTGAPDRKTSSEIIELLSELNEQGNTMVIVTHDSTVANHCGRVIRMIDGQIT
jgi:putative ABC transport system ATP-binding protein